MSKVTARGSHQGGAVAHQPEEGGPWESWAAAGLFTPAAQKWSAGGAVTQGAWIEVAGENHFHW